MKQPAMDDTKVQILGMLETWSGHSQVKLTNRCNSAIFLAFHIAKQRGIDTILIPDQGGWLTFRTYPIMLGLKTETLKTNQGIIDMKVLEKLARKGSALVITSLAGYLAPQPLQEISKICKKAGCLLIEDASGVVLDPQFGGGHHSDILVGSFGKWKPVNLGYGGFISTDIEGAFEIDAQMLRKTSFNEDYLGSLLGKLGSAEARIDKLHKICVNIKSDLKDYGIIHRDKEGLNVAVRFKSTEEKENIINYCKTQGYEFTICPRYIRIMENAVCIEVKRLNI